MSIHWPRLARIIAQHERFLLTTHISPDGDAIGCQLAMRELLRAKGKQVEIVNPDRTPLRYAFLDPAESIRVCPESARLSDLPPHDLLMILDTGVWSQLGRMADLVRADTVPKIVLDHHLTQDADIGAEWFVDPQAEATGSIVLGAFDALGVALNRAAAEALFVAIAMDTGWFRFEKTSAATLRAAARLVDAGVDLFAMHVALNLSSRVERLRLLGRLLESLRMEHEGRVACAELTQSDFRQTGADFDDTEELIQVIQSVRGADVAVLLVEKADGQVKISLRSHGPVDCTAVAARFNGGGHRAASGATLAGPLAEARRRVLEAIRQVMRPAGSVS